MKKPSRMSVSKEAIGLSDRPCSDFSYDQPSDTAKGEPCQRLITSAILATTAFRMRDDAALTEALRMLVRAVKPFESDFSKEQDRSES